MGKLDNKVAIIVGSTSGIGKSMAELYAAEGATVIVTGRRENYGVEVVEGIKAAGGVAEFKKLDVANLNECYELIDYTVDKYGKLDILVYNPFTLGDRATATIETLNEETWDITMTVNLKNGFFMAKKALPELEKTKGNIVFTASMVGIAPTKVAHNTPVYGISKAGLTYAIGLLGYWAADKGVRVNGVAPGICKTEGWSQSTPEEIAAYEATIPMGAMSEPEDIAKMAVYLSTDDARMITGQTIQVCGGASIH